MFGKLKEIYRSLFGLKKREQELYDAMKASDAFGSNSQGAVYLHLEKLSEDEKSIIRNQIHDIENSFVCN